ncbi:hypothetical protein niasHT_004632 [Heterodera trifolii]|uniref:Uncharacterized protein n=1 Tax=Heterodera trifolii TaxID=157864 RepID=A0ABD2M9R1_9BILA
MNDLLPLPNSLSSPSLLSSSSADAAKEYRMVLLGTQHKKPLFEKMCSAAQKFEQHIQYADIWYLTFQFKDSEEPVVVEIIDPGTEKTGERQMAIQQKSDAIILCYSAFNPDSFLALESVTEDFQTFNGKAPATLLLCNEDQLAEEGFEDGHETDTADDGYGTNSGGGSPSDREMPSQTVPKGRSTTPTGRQHSMERIREAREGGRCPIGKEKGEQLCHSLGPNCEFRSLSFADQLADHFVLDLIGQLIRRGAEIRQNNRRNRPARPNAHRRRLSPSPLVHILRRKTSIIRRKIMPKVKSKSRERAKTTNGGEEKHRKEEEKQTQEETKKQKASTSASQELAATTSKSMSIINENANGDNGTTKDKPQNVVKKQKNYVQGMGAMLKTLTHPRERVRVGASKETENVDRSTQRQSARTASEADSASSTRVNNFIKEGETTETEEQQKEQQQQQQKERSDRTQSTACTIQ